MFSLPDIVKMNAKAAQDSKSGRLSKCLKKGVDPDTGKKGVCDHADSKCQGEVISIFWYDIFSEDPKGILFLCDHHYGYSGNPTEGYFNCAECDRVFIDNYTGELYYVNTPLGPLCLNCYARSVLDDDANWLPLNAQSIDSITFEYIRHRQHIIAVKGPTHGLEFHGNVEFDSTTGTGLYSTSNSREIAELKEILVKAKSAGHKRAIMILDSAFKFAISIGVYTDYLKK